MPSANVQSGIGNVTVLYHILDEKLMTPEHTAFLSNNSANLIANMNPDSIINQLLQKNVLNRTDCELVSSQCSMQNKAACLLKILERKPDRVCEEFMKALSKTGQVHLLNVVNGKANTILL